MTILFTIWAIAANWLAYSKGYYRLPKASEKDVPLITHLQLLTVFGLYLFLSFVVSRFFTFYLLSILKQTNSTLTSLPIGVQTGLQFFIMGVLILILQWFMLDQNRTAYFKIWKNRAISSSSIVTDFGLGAITWAMSFPIVTVIAELIDMGLKTLFHFERYEQTAVKFVKVAVNTPTSLVFAFLCVLILAPLIEEFLFRGMLQTYLKKRMGAKASILLSALLFALFHFAHGQGVGNVSLIISLMILGSFLGFLYERQGSLWAPIGLHVTFNAVSALRILITPELS